MVITNYNYYYVFVEIHTLYAETVDTLFCIHFNFIWSSNSESDIFTKFIKTLKCLKQIAIQICN